MANSDRYVFKFSGDGDDGGEVLLPQGFEYPDVKQLGMLLETGQVFVPGYDPPLVGLYSPDGFIYERHVENIEATLLPDLNVAADWVQLASGEPATTTRKLSASILAFCQHLYINVDPSIACHELAHRNGNQLAFEKYGWIRAAEKADFNLWRDIGLGRNEKLNLPLCSHPVDNNVGDLSLPLKRWNRNYICALKVAELELAPLEPIERAVRFMHWMRDEFIIAGPAFIFSCILFAPNSAPKAGLLKRLRSLDRQRALSGIRNTAWDITHVSEFVRNVNEHQHDHHRFIFASHDRGLLNIAEILLACSADRVQSRSLTEQLSKWWPVRNASRIADMYDELLCCIDEPNRKARQAASPQDVISRLIRNGEHMIESWSPTC